MPAPKVPKRPDAEVWASLEDANKQIAMATTAKLSQAKAEMEQYASQVIQYRNEITALKAHAKEIRESTELETKKQLRVRQAELDKMKKEADVALRQLKNDSDKQAKELNRLTNETNGIERGNRYLESQQEYVRSQVDYANKQLEEAKHGLEATQNTQTGLYTRISDLNAQIQPLKEQITTLNAEITTQTEKKASILAMIAELEAQAKSKEQELNLRIAELNHKRTDLATDLSAEMAEMERARQELATRQIALDKKDQILRVREVKVSQAEAKITQNANLLNL